MNKDFLFRYWIYLFVVSFTKIAFSSMGGMMAKSSKVDKSIRFNPSLLSIEKWGEETFLIYYVKEILNLS